MTTRLVIPDYSVTKTLLGGPACNEPRLQLALSNEVAGQFNDLVS
jgi:hypothetical protein